MHNVLIIVDSLSDWEPYLKTDNIIESIDYLEQSNIKSKFIINLCNDITYNSNGYYCSLLAQAREHKIIPSVKTINKLNNEPQIRLDTNLQKICINYLQKNNITEDKWYLEIYFGKCKEKGLEKVARYIFDKYPCPIIKVEFNTKTRTQITNISTLKLSELSDEQQDIFAESLSDFNKKVWKKPKTKKNGRYDIGIFYDPNEKLPPSNKKTLNKFIKVGKKMNIDIELITEDDLYRILEFDAIFIRQTTNINHITFKLAQRCKYNNIVVLDDPDSIIKCTNKVYLKELLDKAKISSPKSMLLFKQNKYDYNDIIKTLGEPFIIKIPDGSFSLGVKKINNIDDFNKLTLEFYEKSSVLLLQEFLPTEFDWRIGVLNNEPIFACKYYMSKGHWQIYNHKNDKSDCGIYETVPINQVPKMILRNALKATELIGDGLYGVDMKLINGKSYVIEINDNPNIDYGVEDLISGDDLYHKILSDFIRRLEEKHK